MKSNEEAPTLPASGRFPLPWRRRLPRFQHQDAFHCHNNVTLCNNHVKFNGVSTFSLSSLPFFNGVSTFSLSSFPFSLRSLDPSKSTPISCTFTHNTPCCIYISASNSLPNHLWYIMMQHINKSKYHQLRVHSAINMIFPQSPSV